MILRVELTNDRDVPMLSNWLVWLILAGVLAVSELMSGTFYLLIFAAGAGTASALAYGDFSITAQLLASGAVSLAGWLLVRRIRPPKSGNAPESDPNLNMDIGTTVQIASADGGKISVIHRGAKWDAQIEDGGTPDLRKDYVIAKVRGSHLVLSEKK